MKNLFKKIIRMARLDTIVRRYLAPLLMGQRYSMNFPPYNKQVEVQIRSSVDPIRYGMMALAIHNIQEESIEGNFAEVGVFRGETSRYLHLFAPNRTLYLFDSFKGFPAKFLDNAENNRYATDNRFRDTSLDVVKRNLGDLHNIIFKVGIFPETATGMENDRFAFVLLDMDLYKSTLAGLEFFYPRVTPGGYIFVHDYHSTEKGVKQAVTEFLKTRPERPIAIPDVQGSIVIRKNK